LVPSLLNTQLDDKPFKEKEKILETNGVAIPQEIAKLDDLTPAVIRRRTNNLAKQVYQQVWKI